MNQAIRKLSGLLVLPVLLAALLLLPVSAKAEEYACDAAIPVTMQLNGTHSEKFEVTIECAENADENQPMPAADNQALMLADEEQGCFTIHYTEPGDYFYIVRQTAGSTAYMSYDLTVYEIQVQVTNATAADGSGAKAVFKLKSMKGVVKKVTIAGAKKRTVKAGKALKLKAKVTATKGANKKLKWISSNEEYATVSASGKVKTKKAGNGKTVKITAMATDGSGKKQVVKIKIK